MRFEREELCAFVDGSDGTDFGHITASYDPTERCPRVRFTAVSEDGRELWACEVYAQMLGHVCDALRCIMDDIGRAKEGSE